MSESLRPRETQRAARRRPTARARAGVALLGLSALLWLPLPALPFLSLTGTHKAALGSGLAVGAEIAFWLGAVLAGPEAARRTRSWFGRAREKRTRRTDPSA